MLKLRRKLMNNYFLEDLESVPRKGRIRPATVLGRCLVWLILGASLVMGLAAANYALTRLHNLRDTGELVTADIVDRREHDGKGTTYYLTVSFRHGEESVVQEREVNYPTYRATLGDSHVDVTTMPNNPRDFEIGAVTGKTIFAVQVRFVFGLSLLYLFTASLVLALELGLRYEVNLLSNGVAVMATVDYTKLNSVKTVATNVGYTYDTPFGHRNGLISLGGDVRSKYPDGSGLVVLYKRDTDHKSRPVQSFTMVELVEPVDD